MDYTNRYRDIKYEVGRLLLGLRTRAKLTQTELAKLLGVSMRSIQNWEAGENYPKDDRLRALIETYLRLQVFYPGQEHDEAVKLWEQVSQDAPQKLGTFDESWFKTIFNQPAAPSNNKISNLLREEWQGAPFQSVELYGRESELIFLEEQICDHNARLVGLIGIGGVGKTALAFKLTQTVKTKFEYVIWYSLANAPSLDTTLSYLLNIVLGTEQSDFASPTELRVQLGKLLQRLQETRCLLVLDNFETILASGSQSGSYLYGYDGYGLLLELVGQQSHQSCLLLTSREKPKELAVLEKRYGESVTSLAIRGLSAEDGARVLAEEDNAPVIATREEWEKLVNYYYGNPLALKLLAEPLQLVFGGKVATFLEEHCGVFADIQDLLKQQFERLSGIEQQILYWLAVERQNLSLEELKINFLEVVSPKILAEAVVSLGRRSLLESGEKAAYFGLQPVILEYLTGRLVGQVVKEISQGKIGPFLSNYALLKASTRDYIRESQYNLIVLPVLNELKLTFKSREEVIRQLWQLVEQVRTRPIEEQGYEAGNLINLLVSLKADLSGADFSGMRIKQAYLQGIDLQGVNLAWSELEDASFTNAFGSVEAVAFNSAGNILASGGLDGAVRLWGVPNGQCLKILSGHTDRIWSVAFSPDGKIVASSSNDCTVRLWEVASGAQLATLEGHKSFVKSIGFNPDGTLVVSGGNDGTICLWEVTTGQCLKVLAGHINEIWSVVFSPDGKLLASGSADQTIRLWEVSSGECLSILDDNINWIWSVAFSPDGKLLASGSSDQTVRLWEVATRQCLVVLRGHTNRVYSVAFSPDGKLLASGSSDQTVRLWEVATGQCRSIFQGHLNLVKNLAFNPTGKLLASASPDQSVRLWEVESGACVRIYEGYSNLINSTDYSPDGQYLAEGSDDSLIHLWEVKSGCYLKTLRGHKSCVKTVAFSPTGKILASGSADHTIRLWDVTIRQCVKVLQGYPSWVWSVAFSPDGRILANGGNDRKVYLWDVASGQCLKTLEGHSNFVRKVTFSPDGRFLASASWDYTVRLWDVASGKCLKTFKGHSAQISSVAFSPDGKVLAGGGADHTIRLWNIASGECFKVLEGHADWVWIVNFSPDGQYLISSGSDRKIQLWDTRNWQPLYDFEGHTGIVKTLAFAPTEKMLVGGDANYLRFWDLEGRKIKKVLKSPALYEGMNIFGIRGLTPVQEANLTILGAVR